MNFQLAAIILVIILYPIGFRMATMKEPSRTVMLAGLFVILLFLTSLIYLLISSWLLFLMMLGSGILILFGLAGFSVAAEARRREKLVRELALDTQGLSRHVPYPLLFIDFIAVGGGIYLFVLSIIRCLG